MDLFHFFSLFPPILHYITTSLYNLKIVFLFMKVVIFLVEDEDDIQNIKKEMKIT